MLSLGMYRDWRMSWYASNVVGGGVWQFVYDTDGSAFLERDLVGLCVRMATGRSGFDTVTPTGSQPCNGPQCKTCPFHHPANSFTSSCTNITTHADCKFMNLIYQLQCTECNAFYIGETCHSLSDCVNGHQFTTTVSNPDM